MAQLALVPNRIHLIIVHIDVHIAAGTRLVCGLQMQAYMLVEIARITEGTQAELALQWLEAGVGAYVYL